MDLVWFDLIWLTFQGFSQVLPKVGDNIWSLTLYNNINACFLFVPMMWLNSEFTSLIGSEGPSTGEFWAEMLIAGIFGFAIGYVTGLQIQVNTYIYLFKTHSHYVSRTKRTYRNLNYSKKSIEVIYQ